MKFSPDYNFYELMPAIFLLEINGNCNLGMTFLRAQEFYESANDNFRGHSFTIEEYSKWYTETQSSSKTFSYGQDWRGFNLPSHVIDSCYQINTERLETDNFFLSIVQQCRDLSKAQGYDNFYLLGVRAGDTQTLQHEIAHGLFTTNAQYQKEMSQYFEQLPADIQKYMTDRLLELGYAREVHTDEAQAFLSTGFERRFELKVLSGYDTPFVNTFKSYLGEWTLPKPLISHIQEHNEQELIIIHN